MISLIYSPAEKIELFSFMDLDNIIGHKRIVLVSTIVNDHLAV